MKNYHEVILSGQTSLGTPLISIDKLVKLLNIIEYSDIYPHSMEAFLSDKDGMQIPLIEYSVLGINIGYDTADDVIVPSKQFELFRKKAQAATCSGLDIVFNVWLDSREHLA